MSRLVEHLDDETLLRYADGELSPREANGARSHLEACWQCRVGFEELQKTIAECVRYRRDIQHFLPPPPSSWADLYRRFDEIDRSFNRPNLFERVSRRLRWTALAKWAPVSMALIVAVGLIYRLQEAPAVHAAELLRKAVVASHAAGTKPRLIQIRTSHQLIRRVAGQQGLQASNASSPEMDSVRTLFASAHYDWQDPLSAQSYQEWRGQLSNKRDEVTENKNAYLIRTATSAGPLTEATLRLSIPDLRPVEEHFQFGDREWVEITELAPDTAMGIATTNGAARETLHKVQPELTRDVAALPSNTPPAVERPATISDELQVLLALHRVSADLGDPIGVSRTGGQVLVTGMGIPRDRQREIRSALASNANVTVRFSEPAASSTPTPRSGGAVMADMSQLQSRVAEKVGGRVHFEELSAEVLDLSDQMMARSYALRRLAERFSDATESGLSPADRQALGSLRQEHATALLHSSREIDRVLRPVFASLGVMPPADSDEAAFSPVWQPATEEVFRSSRQVEKLVALMFGAAQNDSSAAHVPAQLQTSLSQLRTRLAAYARIGTEETTRKD